jgi:dTDP-glucose 4,6-dehydratase
MVLKDNKILVTGSDGFIGSHLTEKLVRIGCDVRAFVYYNAFNSYGWIDALDSEIKGDLDVCVGDIRDPYRVKKAMQDCSIVFHLAALIAIPYSYHSPDSYVETNIKGTLNVLQAARALSVKKVIHTSTSEVYGTAQYVPIDENHPLQPQSPYSASKIGADQIAMSFHSSFGTPVAVIRPFNTYGPRQSARAIIPTVISQILQGRDKIKLGSLYPTRDFCFVSDTVEGFIALAQSDRSIGEVINIGSNFEISINDVVQLIIQKMDVRVAVEPDEKRIRPEMSEVDRLWADNSKAKRILDWEPAYSEMDGFKKGLCETIKWFSNVDNLKNYKSNIYNL